MSVVLYSAAGATLGAAGGGGGSGGFDGAEFQGADSSSSSDEVRFLAVNSLISTVDSLVLRPVSCECAFGGSSIL